ARKGQNTQSLPRGVVLVGQDMLARSKDDRLTWLHELLHGLGMIHPFTPELQNAGHRFDDSTANALAWPGQWHGGRINLIGLEAPARLRIGWPASRAVRLNWKVDELSADFPPIPKKAPALLANLLNTRF